MKKIYIVSNQMREAWFIATSKSDAKRMFREKYNGEPVTSIRVPHNNTINDGNKNPE